ncbi:MAG TPA: type II toxin-antitoxin system VapC family toxin [Chthoniobacteraceae bacterium]|nr:type II toxin-antitoxin system VapC family toxin [Chthoniobacteraceae bacterium]
MILAAPVFLLDTNAWLRFFNRPEELSAASRKVLGEQIVVALAAISLWEVSMLVAKGKIILPVPIQKWMELSLPDGRVEVLPITPEIAVDSCHLPSDFHGDPADRLIVATARAHELTVATSDEKILRYPHVKTFSTR